MILELKNLKIWKIKYLKINNNNNNLGIRNKCAAAEEDMNQKKKIWSRKVINDLGILNFEY